MRAKFECVSITEFKGGNETAKLQPVTGGSEENKSFSRFTPSGLLEMNVTNPAAHGFFKPGHSYYLDITEAAE